MVNNHVDTDGMLSVFTLVHAELALAHRQPIVEAAGMGDFMGWGGDEAQRLFQRLALLKIRPMLRRVDPNETYRRCFDAMIELLSAASAVVPEEDVGLAALWESVRNIESGRIRREQLSERLTSYTIPLSLSRHALKQALRIPPFDAPLTDASLLLPQARARFDRERLQLVSVEADSGWYHDLWYPGYVWAETPESWRPDGLVLESSNSHSSPW